MDLSRRSTLTETSRSRPTAATRSVTLDYDDHSDIATISVDRNDVPAGGQVHITISDFQLNLDPTADDMDSDCQ